MKIERVSGMILYLVALAAALPPVRAQRPGAPGHTGIPLAVQEFAWTAERPVLTFSSAFAPATGEAYTTAAPPSREPAENSTAQPRRRDMRQTEAPPTSGQVSSQVTLIKREYYRYTVKVHSLAQKPIRAVVWDYILRDPSSQQERSRLRFRSEKTIKPGETKRLEVFSWRPPAGGTSLAGIKPRRKPDAGDSVEVVWVQYSDQTAWHKE